MITNAERGRTTEALHRLWSADADGRTDTGGYADVPGGPVELGTTLSALKALRLLGTRTRHPDAACGSLLAAHDPATGAWTAPGAAAPSVLATAAGLLGLVTLDASSELRARLIPGLGWMAAHAATREEHFMTIAVADECGVRTPPPRSVAFLRAMERADGTFGPSPLNNGIAASALLRAGESLRDPAAVADLILAAQTAEGGFADTGTGPQLWTTYCCMRALDLLGAAPQRGRLTEWIGGLKVDTGGFGTAGTCSANTTYQCLSILDWTASPAVDAARRGDTDWLLRYLRSGGDPDAADLLGWTPLAAAAVLGQAPVVGLLLAGDTAGGSKAADPDIRVGDADALPIFWAGQSGDVDTVRALLAHRPEHLFATSSVNGHTVLLQAVFFGTDRHRDLVAWLLDRHGEILGVGPDDHDAARAARHRLLAACNVRGYTATTMARLWNNQPLIALLSAVDDTDPAERERYRRDLLASIAPPPPRDPVELAAQRLTDTLVETIARGMEALDEIAHRPDADLDTAVEALLTAVQEMISVPGLDLDRRGGPLGQTPVIAAVTGVDANPRVASARLRLTALLLRHGADPDLPELHPMGVDAVIRAAVLNHFDCLKEIARYLGPLAFAAAINERPAINGQTALDDTVHRALTAPDEAVEAHLDQIRWIIDRGGRTDIPDFTGVTVADRARLALRDPALVNRAPAVLAALGQTAGG